jgi:P27 family predicted phage terminase small subunit
MRVKKPAYITATSKPYWDVLAKHLSNLQGFSEIDAYSLGILANAFADYQDANATLESEGKYFKSGTMLRLHPANEAKKEASKIIASLSAQYGLTPKARESLMRFIPKQEPDALDLLLD